MNKTPLDRIFERINGYLNDPMCEKYSMDKEGMEELLADARKEVHLGEPTLDETKHETGFDFGF
ncbi:hypothetical protein P5U49_000236 [Neisseria gonorrhoeae]